MSIEKCTGAHKPMEEKRIKFGMEMLPSLKRRLKSHAGAIGIPLWAVTQRAVEQYFASLEDKSATPKDNIESFVHSVAKSERCKEIFKLPENARLLALLAEILGTGNDNARKAVTSNLEVFSEYAQIKGAERVHKRKRASE